MYAYLVECPGQCVYIDADLTSAQTSLNCAKISVFDPSGLPLIIAGSKPNFPLGLLAVWESYGIEVRPSHLSSISNGKNILY